MKPIKLTLPEQMSARQRAAEITSILSAAIMRTHASGQSATDQIERQVGLGFSGDQRVHTNPYQTRSSK
ncbi:MAG: hypothetical protein FP823_12825 [Rhodoferax sp.]|nr:hypothetical protein [Rhodoferax sp.]MBA3058760.1 hypothetical protein [Rhodoferax sp.]